MGARQQSLERVCEPLRFGFARAARAKPVLAAVPDETFRCRTGATFQVPAHRRTTTARNQRRGSMLVQWQASVTGVLSEVGSKDPGYAPLHACSMSQNRRLSIPRRSRARATLSSHPK